MQENERLGNCSRAQARLWEPWQALSLLTLVFLPAVGTTKAPYLFSLQCKAQ